MAGTLPCAHALQLAGGVRPATACRLNEPTQSPAAPREALVCAKGVEARVKMWLKRSLDASTRLESRLHPSAWGKRGPP